MLYKVKLVLYKEYNIHIANCECDFEGKIGNITYSIGEVVI